MNPFSGRSNLNESKPHLRDIKSLIKDTSYILCRDKQIKIDNFKSLKSIVVFFKANIDSNIILWIWDW